jgi:hypothetical protein
MIPRQARAAPRVSAQKPATYQTVSIPAPTLGLIANANLAAPQPGGAFVLENYLATATGAILRRGSEAYAQLEGSDDITALFTYVNGNNQSMFCATADSIFDISSSVFSFLVDDDDNTIVDDLGNALVDSSLAAKMDGFNGGNWSDVQFATTGGVFLDLVNGADKKLIYDGTNFYPVGTSDLVSLDYDAETVAFTEGATLTGGTSGATATVVKVIDDGTTGTLWLDSVASGPFQNDETLTDDDGGSAKADGTATTLWGKFDGVDPANLSQNWVYKKRIFYVEENSLNAWYLAVDSITGTATKLPLGGVFTLGGSLLFGSSWSLETGSGGLSEQCIFVTTEGEVAVYQGDDPSSAETWAKVGTYRIGKPLGPNAHFRAGGDIAIATDIGLIPLSQALQKDFAVLSPSAISAQIETIWNDEVKARAGRDWNCLVWSEGQMAIVVPPMTPDQPAVMYVTNSRTGGWSKFTGWQANCLVVFQGRLFFGSNDGTVVEGNVTGADQGSPYTGVYVPMFIDFGVPGRKSVSMSRAITRAVSNPNERLSMHAEYMVSLPAAPDAGIPTSNNVWGGAVWGESKWGGTAVKVTYGRWHSTPLNGDVLALAVQTTSGSIAPLDVEIVRIDVAYTVGGTVT